MRRKNLLLGVAVLSTIMTMPLSVQTVLAGDISVMEDGVECVSAENAYSVEDSIGLPDSEEINGGDEVTEGDYTYYISDGVASIKKYNGTEEEVTLPVQVTAGGVTYDVTGVRSSAFDGKTSIKKLTIPEGISKMDYKSFGGCVNLSEIIIQGNLSAVSKKTTSVFSEAGKNADSLTVSFGEKVTEIPENLFSSDATTDKPVHPHITKLIIGDNVASIGANAFYNCRSLKEIVFGAKLTTIGNSAFENNVVLEKLEFDPALTTIDREAFMGCIGLSELVLNESIVKVNNDAFKGCSGITTIKVEGSAVFGTHVFDNCVKLEKLDIMTLGTLGNAAFKGCTSLKEININGNITTSDDSGSKSSGIYQSISVFSDAGRNSDGLVVTFGPKVTAIPNYLFATGADQSAGDHAYVTKVVVPDSVTTIGKYAFYRCYNLSDVELGKGVTTIGEGAFAYDVKLPSLILGNKIAALEREAYLGCSGIETIEIKGNVDIGKSAFEDCTSVQKIVIDGNCKPGNKAFANCTSLGELSINGNMTEADHATTGSSYKYYSVFLNAGRDAKGGSFVITFGNKTSVIPGYLFATGASVSDGDYTHVTKVVASETVSGIGKYAFYNCHDLKEFVYEGKESYFKKILEEEGNDLSKVMISYGGKDYTPPVDDGSGDSGNESGEEGKDSQIVTISSNQAYLIVGDRAELKLAGIDNSTIVVTGKAGSYKDGILTALKKGNITVKALVGGKLKKVCKVKVEQPKMKTAISVKTGKKKRAKLGGTKQAVIYESSDKTVATVDEKGKVTGVKAGIATITAKVGGHTYPCVVTVI